jgi:hypothetical protein
MIPRVGILFVWAKDRQLLVSEKKCMYICSDLHLTK